MRLISTRVHGVLDYSTACALLTLPRALGPPPEVGRLLAGAGVLTALYSLLTRYELGLIRVLPMKAHLGIDMGSGALFCAAPWMLETAQGRWRRLLLGIGAFELVVPLLSKTRSR